MTKVTSIIENNLITGVQYGTVEIPDTPIEITKAHKKTIQQKPHIQPLRPNRHQKSNSLPVVG